MIIERRKQKTWLPSGLERRGKSWDEDLNNKLWDSWKLQSALFRTANPLYGTKYEEEDYDTIKATITF